MEAEAEDVPRTDISNDEPLMINNQTQTEAKAEDVLGTDISDDEPLMIDNQTQTEAKAEKVTGTLDEGSVVEVILEKKTPEQAPHHGELKKKLSWVKTSTYHHPHHPARQPSRWQPISQMDNNPRRKYREEWRSTYYTSTQKSYHIQLPSQARPRVHITLGWLDTRAWYQWTTLLSRSYYLCSSHVSRTKHAKGGGMLYT